MPTLDTIHWTGLQGSSGIPLDLVIGCILRMERRSLEFIYIQIELLPRMLKVDADRSKNRGQGPPDPNQVAFRIVQRATGQMPKEEPEQIEESPRVTLARAPGIKGGKLRAEKLSPKHRKAIAQNAVEKRWRKNA